MAKLQFELFVTTEEGQKSFVLDQKPIMFGSGPNCDVQLGEGEPTVKAILQKEDDVLLVLEAMKMENSITSPREGVIKSILVSKGDAVDKGILLIEFET